MKMVRCSIFTGDKKKEADYEFNRLDTQESEKQFILLVNKGTEGWNCKSPAGEMHVQIRNGRFSLGSTTIK